MSAKFYPSKSEAVRAADEAEVAAPPADAPFAGQVTTLPVAELPVPFMSSNDVLSEDTIKYLKEKNIGQLMEYILRRIIAEKPRHPLGFVRHLTASPLPPQLAFAGPPASGKGTQAQHIRAYYKSKTGRKPVHISSGDLLRAEVEEGTHLGKIAEACMKAGQLVPDSLIISIIRKRLSMDDALVNGWLLDGFPRNRSQAIALDAAGLCPRVFVVLDAPDEILYERVEGRRTDPVTGNIYHLKFNPPPTDDVALLERLQHRDDDTREVLGPRLETYHSMVDSLLDYYGSIMYRVDANRPEADIVHDITTFLGQQDVS